MKVLVRDEVAEKKCKEEFREREQKDIAKWGISGIHLAWVPDVIYTEIEIPDFEI